MEEAEATEMEDLAVEEVAEAAEEAGPIEVETTLQTTLLQQPNKEAPVLH